MTEEQKTIRIQVSMPDAELQKLDALAATNAGANRSFMLREFIRMAWEDPDRFGLRHPNLQQSPWLNKNREWGTST